MFTTKMKNITVNITKLRSPKNYAKDKGVVRQLIYRMINEDKLDTTDIDGTKFVILNKKALEYRSTK